MEEGDRELPISSCPGYFPLTLFRNVFLSWLRSVVAGQARTPPGSVHPRHSFRQPFLLAACGRTESLGSDRLRTGPKGFPPRGTGGRELSGDLQ